MGYRIQVILGERVLADLASNKPLADTREDAIDAVDMFNADYVLIMDHKGEVIDWMKRSA